MELVGKLGANTLSRKDAQCLMDGGWLNDDIVNMELEMLGAEAAATAAAARGAASGAGKDSENGGEGAFFGGGTRGKPPARLHIANSFLVSKLLQGGKYDFSRVAKWMKRAGVDLRELDAVVLPVHGGSHWSLAAVHLKRREVHYWDSFLSSKFSSQYGDIAASLLRWVSDETAGRGGEEGRLDTSEWTTFIHGPEDVPQQHNSNDCGACVCCVCVFWVIAFF